MDWLQLLALFTANFVMIYLFRSEPKIIESKWDGVEWKQIEDKLHVRDAKIEGLISGFIISLNNLITEIENHKCSVKEFVKPKEPEVKKKKK